MFKGRNSGVFVHLGRGVCFNSHLGGFFVRDFPPNPVFLADASLFAWRLYSATNQGRIPDLGALLGQSLASRFYF